MKISMEQAIEIADWRYIKGCTWRRVADLFCEHYPLQAESMNICPGDQQDGRDLVNAAFDVLGIKEDL